MGGGKLKRRIHLFALFSIILAMLVGCYNKLNTDQYISVVKLVGDSDLYEDFNKVTDNAFVLEVKEILEDADWGNEKLDIDHDANYIFSFQYKSDQLEAKAVAYELWIDTNKDTVFIVKGENTGAVFDTKTSSRLVEILISEKLEDL